MAQTAPEPELPYVLTGPEVLPRAMTIEAAGQFPEDPRRREVWAERAVKAVELTYRRQGYVLAEAFFGEDPDGRPHLHIDEGHIDSVVFEGVNDYQSLMFRVDLNLPDDVFNRPMVEAAIAELKSKYSLADISYRVVPTEVFLPNPLGYLRPQRSLRIEVVSPESFGWSFSASLDSNWGLVPKGGLRLKDSLVDDDRFLVDLAVAVPYRRYLFDAEPKFQWVHGLLGVAYRFPTFAAGTLAPVVDSTVSFSQYSRSDVGLEDLFTLQSLTFASLAIYVPPVLTLAPGVGVDFTHLYDVATTQPTVGVPELELLRYDARLIADLAFDSDLVRIDWRDQVRLVALLTLDNEAAVGVRLIAEGQLVTHFGQNDLIFRGHGVYMTGDVRFFDEVPLAGPTMRVYFGNRYFVREALQLEGALRVSVWGEKMKLGVFADVAGFGDRVSNADRTPVLSAATGFGPSVHFLVFDLFAIDLYYGFGFDRVGFDHNLSFDARTVF